MSLCNNVKGFYISSNKTLNFLKSNPNELKLVQKKLFCLPNQALLFSIFIEILILIMVCSHSYEHFNHSKEIDKEKKPYDGRSTTTGVATNGGGNTDDDSGELCFEVEVRTRKTKSEGTRVCFCSDLLFYLIYFIKDVLRGTM